MVNTLIELMKSVLKIFLSIYTVWKKGNGLSAIGLKNIARSGSSTLLNGHKKNLVFKKTQCHSLDHQGETTRKYEVQTSFDLNLKLVGGSHQFQLQHF